jgi:hypothetical protein
VLEDHGSVDISEAGGKPAPTKLGQGKFEHKSPKGGVLVTFHELRRAFWTKFTATASEPVELAVLSGGFPDGTKVTFEIRHASAGHEPPLETLPATLKDGKARATWKYVQPLAGPATATFAFLARAGEKTAQSPLLRIVPFPLTDLRGIKQGLRVLGYDAGPLDASPGGPLEGALRKFQKDHEPLEETGQLDAMTKNVLFTFFDRHRKEG